jgi:hypothetical protein
MHLSIFPPPRKRDGSITTDMDGTVTFVLEHITPEDKAQDDSEFHKQIRAQSQRSVNISDNREFSFAVIRNVVKA